MSGAAGWPDPDLTADPAEKARSKFARRKKDQLLKLNSLFFGCCYLKAKGSSWILADCCGAAPSPSFSAGSTRLP